MKETLEENESLKKVTGDAREENETKENAVTANKKKYASKKVAEEPMYVQQNDDEKKSVKKSAKKNSIEPKVINQFEKKAANKKDITDHGKNTEKKTAKTNVKEAQSKARITKIAPREKIVFGKIKNQFSFPNAFIK